MQLVIATATITESATAVEVAAIQWVSKGGSSINSADGRFALRKNSKGTWKVLDNGKELAGGLTKDEAKAEAAQAVTGATTDVKAALLAGDAKVYSVRGNGTLRRRHYLTGNDLVFAQGIKAQRDNGVGMAFISDTLHISVSQVRRVLIDLALTEQLTAMAEGELAAMLMGSAE